ncbi:MAG: helix-turn-helix domain-containing protein [Sulfitobacter sp.]
MYQHDQEAFAAHERLKMALRLKGTSLAQIAREVGVSRTTMSLVGLRKISVPRVERAIAEVLEQPVDELFSPISREDEQ